MALFDPANRKLWYLAVDLTDASGTAYLISSEMHTVKETVFVGSSTSSFFSNAITNVKQSYSAASSKELSITAASKLGGGTKKMGVILPTSDD